MTDETYIVVCPQCGATGKVLKTADMVFCSDCLRAKRPLVQMVPKEKN